jgi:large subunit ribosomal protein L25
MDTLTLTLSPREVTGKKVKQLRREGMVPVHLYGRGVESIALQVESGALLRVLSLSGRNVPITVDIDGRDGESTCFVREAQRHPVTEELLHVDFLRVDVTRVVRAEVPVVLDGLPPAVENLGGILLQPFNTLEVEALPMDIPAAFHIDVTGLEDFAMSIRIGDIAVADNVTITRDPAEMIARVVPPRIEEEPEPEVDEDELLEGEAPEGEEAEEGAEGADDAQEQEDRPRDRRQR